MSALLSIAVAGVALFVFSGFHQIEEGHVGVYWRAGQLQERVTEPGFHIKLPLIDRVENVQITMQTDSVKDIPCGTSGGTMVYFDRIEVVNRLRKSSVQSTMKLYGVNYDKMWIFDKIHHEINQFCSGATLQEVYISKFDTLDESLAKAIQADCDKHDTGVEIITVRVTKPRIPDAIRRNYEQVEAERAALQVAVEHQKVIENRAFADMRAAEIEAKKKQSVKEIELKTELNAREAAAKMAAVANSMHLDSEKSRADAAYYKALKEAEANKLRFTPEYLKHALIQAISNNSKVYFGDKIPNMFLTHGGEGLGLSLTQGAK